MKTLLLTLMSAAASLAAQSAPAHWQEAAAAAKAQGKDVAVHLDGSDWSPVATSFRDQVLGASAVRDALAKGHIRVSIDSPENPSDAAKALAEPNKPFGFRPWNLPGLALADERARAYGYVAAAEARDAADFLARLNAILAARERMRGHLAAAEALQGEARADALGKALAEIDLGLARGQFGEVVKEIAKLDPKDATGWRLRYEFNDLAFLEGTVLRLVRDKKVDEALREIDQRLANTRLTPDQRQRLLAARFAALRQGGRMPEALQVLPQVAAIDGRSVLGRGALTLRDFHTRPVQLRGWSWDGWDMRPDFTPMEIDAAGKVSGAGNYVVELKGGGLDVRSVALVAGGKVLAETDKREGQAWRLHLAERPPLGVRLRINARGQGWFGGNGTIELRKE
jgi:hypothetical protein